MLCEYYEYGRYVINLLIYLLYVIDNIYIFFKWNCMLYGN